MRAGIGLFSESEHDAAIAATIRDAGLDLAFHVPTWGKAITACDSHRPSVLLVSQQSDLNLAPFFTLIPNLKVLVLLKEPNFYAAQEARSHGASDVLLVPDELPKLPALLQRLRTGSASWGQLTLVCSPKGGCGGSLIAAGLAQAFAPNAVLVDLNLAYGGAETLLNLQPDRTVLDLAPLATELEERHLLQAVTPHASGIAVLCSPARASLEHRLGVAEASAILVGCRQQWVHTVVDLPGTNLELLSTLAKAADNLLLVTTPDPMAMRAVHLLLQGDALSDSRHVGLVVNRWTRRSPFRSAEMASRLGLPLLAEVPDDPVLASRVALGQPLFLENRQRSGRAAGALIQLAARLTHNGQRERRQA